ncbi:MAG: PEP-CTERM sorting domain-containing protein [Verrucomicrobiota bacterium JB023]|nr:PEP-CTERM sorting domain-containing protein [Verrucomicrobiota bacterium JB023]
MKKNPAHKKFLSTAVLFSAVVQSPAAIISWQSSVDMYQGSTVETFVTTQGDALVGYNATTDTTSGNTAVTVNGVSFTPQNTGVPLIGTNGVSITINGGTDNENAFGDGEFTSNAAIFHLIRGGTFGVTSVTFGGLTIGQEYLIQSFNNDARGSRNSNFITGYGDGTNSSSPVAFSSLNNNPPGPSAGDSIIGTFIADSTSQSFNIFGTNGGPAGTFNSGNSQSQINAIQLRAIPEPSSAALLGLAGATLLLRRRK